MSKLARIAGFAVLNVRYSALILPTGVVAYLLGLPFFLVVSATVLLALATGAELVTSVANGIHAVAQAAMQQQYLDQVFQEIEDYANGSEEGTGEAGEEGSGEGGAGVPAR